MSRDVYLEMTYRHGKPVAGYLWLPGHHGGKAARTKEMGTELVVDYAGDGRPMGIEIIYPGHVTLAEINAVLAELKCESVSEKELAPLFAVCAS